jgi:hypothetical protein
MESLKRVAERGVVIASRHRHTNESCVLHEAHVNGQTTKTIGIDATTLAKASGIATATRADLKTKNSERELKLLNVVSL